jgi:hypothetical protein
MIEIIKRYKRVVRKVKQLPQLSKKEKNRLICVAWCEEALNLLWKAPIIIPLSIIGYFLMGVGAFIQAIATVIDGIGYVCVEFVNSLSLNCGIGLMPKAKVEQIANMIKENNKF